MTRLNLVLLAALLGSCLLLVSSAYESRRVFAALDQARGEQRQLEAEYKRLDAERQAQATHQRVDKVARERFKMSSTAAATHYVVDTDTAASGVRQ